MSQSKIDEINARRDAARAMRASMDKAIAEMRARLEDYEAATAAIAQAAGIEVLRDGSGGITTRKRGGRKFGDINKNWRRVLGVLKDSRPDGFTVSDVVSVAAFEGSKLRPSAASARIKALLERNLVGPTDRKVADVDLFRVTGEAVHRFGLGQGSLEL